VALITVIRVIRSLSEAGCPLDSEVSPFKSSTNLGLTRGALCSRIFLPQHSSRDLKCHSEVISPESVCERGGDTRAAVSRWRIRRCGLECTRVVKWSFSELRSGLIRDFWLTLWLALRRGAPVHSHCDCWPLLSSPGSCPINPGATTGQLVHFVFVT
jgi:hypothetical protein